MCFRSVPSQLCGNYHITIRHTLLNLDRKEGQMNNRKSITDNNEAINFANQYPNIEKVFLSYVNLARNVELACSGILLLICFITNGFILTNVFLVVFYGVLSCYSWSSIYNYPPLKRLERHQVISIILVLIAIIPILFISVDSLGNLRLESITIVFFAIKTLATPLIFLVLCVINKKYSLFNGSADYYCQFYMSGKAHGIDSPLFEDVENRLRIVGTIKEQSNYDFWRSSLISLSIEEEVQKMNGIIRMKRMITSKDSHFFTESTIKFVEGMNNTKQYSKEVEASLLRQFK